MFIIFLGRDYPALFQLGHARFAQQSRRRGGQRGSSAEGGLRTAANTRAGQGRAPSRTRRRFQPEAEASAQAAAAALAL